MVILRMLVDPRPDTEESLELMEQNRLKLCKLLSEGWEDEKKIEIKNIENDIDDNAIYNNIKNDDFSEFSRQPSNSQRIPGFCESRESYGGNNIGHSFTYYDYANNTKYYRNTTNQQNSKQYCTANRKSDRFRLDQSKNENHR
jgi:hypothetical protein